MCFLYHDIYDKCTNKAAGILINLKNFIEGYDE